MSRGPRKYLCLVEGARAAAAAVSDSARQTCPHFAATSEEQTIKASINTTLNRKDVVKTDGEFYLILCQIPR